MRLGDVRGQVRVGFFLPGARDGNSVWERRIRPVLGGAKGTGALRGTRCAASTFSSGSADSDPVGGAYGLLLLMQGYYTSAGVAPVHSYQPWCWTIHAMRA